MSKRLQVVLGEDEMAAVTDDARRHGVTLSAWVRSVLRRAHQAEAGGDPGRKLAALRAAAAHDFPTADIGRMLEEIERGYAGR